MHIKLIATVEDGDFSSLLMPLTFAPGSSDGAEMCASVIANSDDLVESEEYFVVQLALVTPAGNNLRLGNSETTITLTDSDGTYSYTLCLVHVLINIPYSCTVCYSIWCSHHC